MGKLTKSAVLSSILSILVLLSSCKDDDDNANGGIDPPATKKEMLVGNNWSIIAYTIDPAQDFDDNGTLETDVLPYIPDCIIDDFIDFNDDQSYTIDEGPTNCEPTSPQVYESGTWAFNADETVIIYSPDGEDIYEWSIISISAAILELQGEEVVDGITYTSLITFD